VRAKRLIESFVDDGRRAASSSCPHSHLYDRVCTWMTVPARSWQDLGRDSDHVGWRAGARCYDLCNRRGSLYRSAADIRRRHRLAIPVIAGDLSFWYCDRIRLKSLVVGRQRFGHLMSASSLHIGWIPYEWPPRPSCD
jgi:hypothetical protein